MAEHDNLDQADRSEMAGDDELQVAYDGAAVHFVLNRPRALNALNDQMKAKLAEAIPVIARNPNIYAVIWRSTNPKAFCAGGDIRELVQIARQDMAAARASLASEYALNWLIDCFSKPTVALLDGLVMGSGAGLVQYATHKVAGENYAFGMPETAVGFFPDVGVAQILASLPDQIGFYLGLTGRTIDRADAFALGLATHCIDAAEFDGICAELADAQTVDPLLDGRHADPGPGALAPFRKIIAAAFSASRVEDIIDRLEQAKGADAAANQWIDGVLADLASRSPTALKVTLRHLMASRARDLRETLIADYGLACRFLAGEDFYEGVRAVLVDKDGQPNWRPATLQGVSEEMVAQYFLPPESGGLELRTRDEMQASRV